MSEEKEKIGPHSLVTRELRKHVYPMKHILCVCTPCESREEGSMNEYRKSFPSRTYAIDCWLFSKKKKKVYILSSSLVDDHYLVQKILRFLDWACNNCFYF